MLSQRIGNLHDPQHYVRQVVSHIRHSFPFFNRTRGADHVFWSTQDLGGCVLPTEIRSSIVVSHFGFTRSLADWMSTRLWVAALDAATPSSSARLLDGAKWDSTFRESASGQISDDGTWTAAKVWEVACRLDPLSTSCKRWRGACFEPNKDIIVPNDFVVPTELLQQVQDELEAAGPDCQCPRQRRRKHLIFISGSLGDEGRCEICFLLEQLKPSNTACVRGLNFKKK